MSEQNPYRGSSVKKNLMQFFLGRAGSALITFFSFAAIAHWLPLTEYGLYMLALSIFEISLALSTLGFEWVSARWIPEFRLNASSRQLRKLLKFICGIQLISMLIAALILFLLETWLAGWLGQIELLPIMPMIAAMLLIEGCSRMIRDQLLAALMLQGLAQFGQILRNLAILSMVLLASSLGYAATAWQMMWFEMIAASIALCFALFALFSQLLKLNNQLQKNTSDLTIELVPMFRLAASAYINYLCTLPVSPWVLSFLLSRYLGVDAVGIYGFARSLADQVRRYVPVYLLAGIIQPVLSAHWAAEQDFKALSLRLSLLYKASLFFVLPLLVLFSAMPRELAQLIGGEKMASAGPSIAIFMLLVSAYCLRRITEISCHLVRHAEITAKTSLGMLLALPIIWFGLEHGAGLNFVLSLMIIAEIYFSVCSLFILSRKGFSLGFELSSIFRMYASAVLTVIFIKLFMVFLPFNTGLFMAGFLIFSIALFFICSFALRPLSSTERVFLLSILPKNKIGKFASFFLFK